MYVARLVTWDEILQKSLSLLYRDRSRYFIETALVTCLQTSNASPEAPASQDNIFSVIP